MNWKRHADTWRQPSVKWPVSARPSTLPTVAAIATIALCLQGCASAKNADLNSSQQQTTQTTRQEITQEQQLLKLQSVSIATRPVSADTATLTLGRLQMDSLPAGYGKTARQGRATATVVKTAPGAYRFTATCDSMEQQLTETILLAEAYGKQAEALQDSLTLCRTQMQQRRRQSRTLLYMLLAFAAGLAGGFAAANIIRLLLRRD